MEERGKSHFHEIYIITHHINAQTAACNKYIHVIIITFSTKNNSSYELRILKFKLLINKDPMALYQAILTFMSVHENPIFQQYCPFKFLNREFQKMFQICCWNSTILRLISSSNQRLCRHIRRYSSGSKPLKKKQGWPFGSPDTKNFQIFLHARHRATNLGLRSSSPTSCRSKNSKALMS